MRRSTIPVFLFLAFLAISAAARIVSYAPYTPLRSFPAVQHRANRYFVVVETTGLPSSFGAQLVRYDSTGAEEPKVIHPTDGEKAAYTVAAVREDTRQVSTILIFYTPSNGSARWSLSNDSGETWKTLSPPVNFPARRELESFFADRGGPLVRESESTIRIGSEGVPFFFADSSRNIVAVDRAGNFSAIARGTILGTDRSGKRVLVVNSDGLFVFAANGQQSAPWGSSGPFRYGWITDEGGVFVMSTGGFGYYGAPGSTLLRSFTASFAVPTYDYSAAWIVRLGVSITPASLSLFEPRFADPVQQWTDITNPLIEAVHAGASGNTLLIQVHRPRPIIEQARRVDPALAIWRVGEPAPRSYDELYLVEADSKGFVHLDVDAAANGAPFVFDSGNINFISPPPFSAGGGGGGSDIVQEWGLVRGSLKQTLVLPGVGRAPGAFGTFWMTDAIFHNPSDATNHVRIRYVTSETSIAEERELTLAGREIRYVSDVLLSIFGRETGGGVFYIDADVPINVTSRTYTRATNGSYGFGMPAYDIFAATTARFPVTFCGAFPGPNFRTNLIVADAGGSGSASTLGAISLASEGSASAVAYQTPAGGQTQLNNIGKPLGILSGDTGALSIAPSRGSAIASVFAIDNFTNDPTWFPPDLASTVARSIPAVGHLDGANGSHFRSDLYLYNPTNVVSNISIEAHAWDGSRSPAFVQLSLLPNESRVIRDVLLRVFGWTGIARLRISFASNIRYSARTYSIDADGGTYGSLMPPLNAFQIASAGETLEILGAVIDGRFRTNIGIVELSAAPITTVTATVLVEIFASGGNRLDNFNVTLTADTGVQINDVFKARNITGENKPVMIRLTSLNRVIGAYATINDNGTNDSVLLSAQFAAKE